MRRTNPSTTGKTLAVFLPMSTTIAVPFPLANLHVGLAWDIVLRRKDARTEHARVGDVESWNTKFFKHDLGHAFTVGLSIPSGFGHEYWMFSRVGAKQVIQCMRNDGRNRREVVYYAPSVDLFMSRLGDSLMPC